MEYGITAITSDFGSEDSSSILDAPTKVPTKPLILLICQN